MIRHKASSHEGIMLYKDHHDKTIAITNVGIYGWLAFVQATLTFKCTKHK